MKTKTKKSVIECDVLQSVSGFGATVESAFAAAANKLDRVPDDYRVDIERNNGTYKAEIQWSKTLRVQVGGPERDQHQLP